MRPSDLDPDRWRQIDRVFEAALEVDADGRDAFLRDACGEDEELRSEVEALLDARDRADDRFEAPVTPLGTALLAARSSFAENRRVGPFRILREIGRGGMGIVHLAEDTRLGRVVALKALPRYLGAGDEAKRRFASEARAVSKLDHPNIATLHDIDETEDGLLYMVFAYYEGETLADRVERGPIPPKTALEIATGITRGLAAAHECGIVHRDVKPSNVLLTERGEVKLLDFGVAKIAGDDVTQEDLRPGTIAYMSPERVGDGPADARTDLWSLGVVLHEMLAGTRPFSGENHASLIASITRDDRRPLPPPDGDLAEGLHRIADRLLSRESERRYESAQQLLDDLEALSAGRPAAAIRAPGADQIRDARFPAESGIPVGPVVLGLALVLLLVAGVWLATRGSRVEPDGITRLAVLPLTDLTGDDAQGHLVAGVHALLNAELGKIRSLRVIPRTSVLRYRDAGMPISEIAGELEVDAVLEGSVLLERDSFTVAATLWETSSPDGRGWAETFRRSIGDVYELSDEMAGAIATALGAASEATGGAPPGADRRVDPEAYEAFSLGLFHVEQRTRESFDQARRYFLEAIEIDSTFAPAWAGLAEAYGSAAFFGLLRPSDVMPQVATLARTGLRHDSTLADAYAALGAVELYWEWDWAESERLLRRAIEVNPSHATSHRRLSEVLSVLGRYDEALESVERGSELDRMVPFAAFRPVVVLNDMRDFDRAIERAEAGLRFFPTFWQGHLLLCQSLAGERAYGRAIDACEEATRLSDRSSIALANLAQVYAAGGRRVEARQLISELEARSTIEYVGGTQLAAAYGALGDLDAAFDWLERAYDQKDMGLVHLGDGSPFDPLRHDPRFQALLERIGLLRGDDNASRAGAS